MLVLLIQNVNKLGNKNQIKDVNDGYAKNFLFPKKLAVKATPDLIKKAEVEKALEEKTENEKIENAKKQAKEMEGKRFIIKMNAGEEGQLFESVSSKKIAEKVKQNGFDVEEKQIVIKEPIKKIGEFKVGVKLNTGLESTIIVVIDKE